MNKRDLKPGFIYLFKEWEQTYRHKIGLARNVIRRAKEIGYVDIIHSFSTDNMAIAECELHTTYSKLCLGNEWFYLYEPCAEFIVSIKEYKDKWFYLEDGTTWRLSPTVLSCRWQLIVE